MDAESAQHHKIVQHTLSTDYRMKYVLKLFAVLPHVYNQRGIANNCVKFYLYYTNSIWLAGF